MFVRAAESLLGIINLYELPLTPCHFERVRDLLLGVAAE
jgi:hypothetical protein